MSYLIALNEMRTCAYVSLADGCLDNVPKPYIMIDGKNGLSALYHWLEEVNAFNPFQLLTEIEQIISERNHDADLLTLS